MGMPLIKAKVRKINTLLDCFHWMAPLLSRVALGWVFLWAGYSKFGNLEQVVGFFQSIGNSHGTYPGSVYSKLRAYWWHFFNSGFWNSRILVFTC